MGTMSQLLCASPFLELCNPLQPYRQLTFAFYFLCEMPLQYAVK